MQVYNNFNTPRAVALLALSFFLSACNDSDNDSSLSLDPVKPQSSVSARVATDADLLSGPLARGVAGDYVLENENLRI